MRRATDVILAGLGLIVLSPLFVAIAAAVWLDAGRPVFFQQERVGRGFRRFRLYKFRTMVVDAEHHGGQLTARGDARITRVGAILRRAKLDELPQLLNVVKGDMSLVGPRPEVPRYVEQFRDDYEVLLTVRPGITDPASLRYHDEEAQLQEAQDAEEEYVSRILPSKIRIAKAYLAERSMLHDLYLVSRTIFQAMGAALIPRFVVSHKRTALVLCDLALICAANVLAFAIRFDGVVPPDQVLIIGWSLPILLAVRGLAFDRFRLYEGLWRYTDLWDLRDIALAIGASSAVFYGLVRWGVGATSYPRSVFVIDALLLIVFLAGSRLARRVYTELAPRTALKKVLIVGAGNAGEMICRNLMRHDDFRPIGFVDDDRTKVGRYIHGLRVLGTRRQLRRIVAHHQPAEVLVAMRKVDAVVMREIVTALEPFTVRITRVPSLGELVHGESGAMKVRQVSIEDLLPRDPVDLDPAPVVQLIAGRCVMVTGAGGSIGSELCRQVAALRPSRLVLYERYENGLYAIHTDLTDSHPQMDVRACIGDVTDAHRLDEVFEQHQPALVFHAAAHKHVPLMEDNPCEAVKNNVVGTRLVARAAVRHAVERLILISTDKAVHPTSVMGVTKRIGELIVQAHATDSETSFSIVRFGNVLGSNGSVLHRFVDQIKAGGPVTVTDPNITRYFMLISEAVELVLHAAAQGERSTTYVLDMGEQIRMLDFARTLIRLSGYSPEEIPIAFTGLRPGEKMYEELVGTEEIADTSGIDKILRITRRHAIDPEALFDNVTKLVNCAASGDTAHVLEQLRAIEPTFSSDQASPLQPLPETLIPAVPLPVAVPLSVMEGLRCPTCASTALQRSRAKSAGARIRKRFTRTRPHRCRDCGWHGWVEPHDATGGAWLPRPEPAGPDFGVLDEAIHSSSLRRGSLRLAQIPRP